MPRRPVTSKQDWKYFTQPLWLSSRSDISPLAKDVYGCLYQFLVMGKTSIFPKIKSISDTVGRSDRRVHDCIKELERAGLVDVERRVGKPNIYLLFADDSTAKLKKVTADGSNCPMAVTFRTHKQDPADDTLIYINKEKNKDNICEVTKESSLKLVVVKSIFEYWKKEMGKTDRVILSKERRRKIEKALKDGYSEDDLKSAIDGCANSEFHVINKYTGIDLIFRDPSKIDFFIEKSEGSLNDDSLPTSAQALQYCIAKREDAPLCALVAHRKAVASVGGNKRDINLHFKGQEIYDKYYAIEKAKQLRMGDDYDR